MRPRRPLSAAETGVRVMLAYATTCTTFSETPGGLPRSGPPTKQKPAHAQAFFSCCLLLPVFLAEILGDAIRKFGDCALRPYLENFTGYLGELIAHH